MSMTIVTGYEGTPHVTSWQDRDLNQGIIGSGVYILNVGSKLEASIVSNNQINIADGVLMIQGCQGVIQKGTTESLSIDNGTQGMMRNDLICGQYSRNASTGVESMSLVVLKGTPSSSDPSDPTFTQGDIQNGATLVQVPIYRVRINGLTVESVDLYADFLQPTISDLNSSIEAMTANTAKKTTKSGTIATATGTQTLHSLSLPAGTYVIIADLATGAIEDWDYQFWINYGETVNNYDKTVAVDAGKTGTNCAHLTKLINLANTTTISFILSKDIAGSTSFNLAVSYFRLR